MQMPQMRTSDRYGGEGMTEHDIDRIQSAINHIKTATDIDPWAMDIAVEAMQEKMEHFAEISKKDDLRESTKKTGDAIWRQDALDKFEQWLKVSGYSEGELNMLKAVLYELYVMPPAHPEIKPIDYRDCTDAVLMMEKE